MYTKEEEAIHFIFLAFKEMKRKKEDIDLAFHSIMVGNMLKSINCDEETVITGYLHDVIEDTNYTYADILNKFGKNIADSVANLSDDRNIKDWKERKIKFLEHLNTINDNMLLVELADKLQNLVSDYSLYIEKGKDYLNTESSCYDEVRWYYLELSKLFNSKIKNNLLLNRFNEIVNIYFK